MMTKLLEKLDRNDWNAHTPKMITLTSVSGVRPRGPEPQLRRDRVCPVTCGRPSPQAPPVTVRRAGEETRGPPLVL
jgi:hypothetical protein